MGFWGVGLGRCWYGLVFFELCGVEGGFWFTFRFLGVFRFGFLFAGGAFGGFIFRFVFVLFSSRFFSFSFVVIWG